MIHSLIVHDLPNAAISDTKLNYNCALIELKNAFYLISRSQNSLRKPSYLSLSRLELHKGKMKVRESRPLDIPYLGSTVEDPRAVVVNDEVFIFYNNGAPPKFKDVKPTDYTLHVACFDSDFNLKYTQPLTYDLRNRCEKNWQMFFDSARKKWMCIYSVNPWVVLEFDDKWHATKLYERDHDIGWAWGEIRGGASPVLVLPPTGICMRNLPASTYYAFFHSSYAHPVRDLNIPRQYVGGLLTFETVFPYLPKGISRIPILTPVKGQKSAVAADVVFPSGAILKGKTWYVSFGSGDCQCKIAQFNHDELECNLVFHKGLFPK